jgi:hypothetical protein
MPVVQKELLGRSNPKRTDPGDSQTHASNHNAADEDSTMLLWSVSDGQHCRYRYDDQAKQQQTSPVICNLAQQHCRTQPLSAGLGQPVAWDNIAGSWGVRPSP